MAGIPNQVPNLNTTQEDNNNNNGTLGLQPSQAAGGAFTMPLTLFDAIAPPSSASIQAATQYNRELRRMRISAPARAAFAGHLTLFDAATGGPPTQVAWDPFAGSSDALLTDPGQYSDASFATPWSREEEVAFAHHVANTNISQAFLHGREAEPTPSWSSLRDSFREQFPQFPARELSDMLARWAQLRFRFVLTDDDRRAIWVMRNSTRPESWEKIELFFIWQGKSNITLEDLVSAEREWGYRLNIANMGFIWPQPQPSGTGYMATAEGSAMLKHQFEMTMQEALEREEAIVEALRLQSNWSLYQIAQHYRDAGVAWDSCHIENILDELERRSEQVISPRLLLGEFQEP